MYLLLVALPLLSSFSLLLFGRFLGRLGASFISITVILFSFFLAIFSFYEVSLLSTSTLIVLPISWFSVDLLNVE